LIEVGADRLGLKKFVEPHQQKITVAEMLDNLKTNYETRGKWNARVASHVKALKAGIGHRRAFQLTRKHVESYVIERQKEGKANATINNELQLLAQSFKITEGAGNGPHFRRLPEDNAREGFFEKSEVEALVKELPDFLQDYTRFGFLTGWRKGEISSLLWADFDMEARTLRLPHTESKNREGRRIPLVGELWEIIQRRWNARACKGPNVETFLSPLVFHRPSRRGRKYGDKIIEGQPIKDFKKAWETACEKANLPGKLFHDLRRSAARNMRRAGVPEQVAMLITGHKTPSMFRRYSIGNDKDLEEAVLKTQDYLSRIPVDKQNILEFPKASGEQKK
jgi:integrase